MTAVRSNDLKVLSLYIHVYIGFFFPKYIMYASYSIMFV